jgi:metal-responsive CopG/Arc/MetJ family transcriptional regulator
MRTLVDIPDRELREITELSKRRKLSRAALIREAIAGYLAAHRRAQKKDAFGLWGERAADGLAYQDKLRAEW